MKITSKGQVTIPRGIRHKAGLWPGTEVEIVELRGRVEIRKKPQGGRGRRIVDQLRGLASGAMTTDEIMKLTRGE